MIAAGALIVIETLVWPRSMPWKSVAMSSGVSTATPSRPTSPSDIRWSESWPISDGMSNAVLSPVCPWSSRYRKRSLVSSAVPKPANWRIVHRRPRYMLGYTPRVNGYSPGTPIWSGAGRSSSVYSGRIGSPESVVNEVSRSGVAAYLRCHSFRSPGGIAVSGGVAIVGLSHILEISLGDPHISEDPGEMLKLGIRKRTHAERELVQRLGRLLGGLAALVGDLGERRAPVGRVRLAADQAGALQLVDDIGHARAVDLQPHAHLPQRQRPAAAEEEQHQRLVAGERQPERLQHRVQAREQDLLDPHDRGDRAHRGARLCAPALLPLAPRLGDRIERQIGHVSGA